MARWRWRAEPASPLRVARRCGDLGQMIEQQSRGFRQGRLLPNADEHPSVRPGIGQLHLLDRPESRGELRTRERHDTDTDAFGNQSADLTVLAHLDSRLDGSA